MHFSCNLQCNFTLGRCKIGKYKFASEFADVFLTYQTFVTKIAPSDRAFRQYLKRSISSIRLYTVYSKCNLKPLVVSLSLDFECEIDDVNL